MSAEFYQLYKNYSKKELFDIVFSPEDYQVEAVEAASQLIEENNWTAELKKLFDEQAIRQEQEEELYQQELEENASYYKKAVEFKSDGNKFQVRITDVPLFEAALIENRIEFHREDKHIGVQLDTYPTQTYYFKATDADRVDELTKKIGLNAAPYTDIKPFFGFEVKMLLFFIALMALLFLLFR